MWSVGRMMLLPLLVVVCFQVYGWMDKQQIHLTQPWIKSIWWWNLDTFNRCLFWTIWSATAGHKHTLYTHKEAVHKLFTSNSKHILLKKSDYFATKIIHLVSEKEYPGQINKSLMLNKLYVEEKTRGDEKNPMCYPTVLLHTLHSCI